LEEANGQVFLLDVNGIIELHKLGVFFTLDKQTNKKGGENKNKKHIGGDRLRGRRGNEMVDMIRERSMFGGESESESKSEREERHEW